MLSKINENVLRLKKLKKTLSGDRKFRGCLLEHYSASANRLLEKTKAYLNSYQEIEPLTNNIELKQILKERLQSPCIFDLAT